MINKSYIIVLNNLSLLAPNFKLNQRETNGRLLSDPAHFKENEDKMDKIKDEVVVILHQNIHDYRMRNSLLLILRSLQLYIYIYFFFYVGALTKSQTLSFCIRLKGK